MFKVEKSKLLTAEMLKNKQMNPISLNPRDCSSSHCVLLYLIPFEEDASDFLIFWSTHMSQIGERKKIEILRWPSEIAC